MTFYQGVPGVFGQKSCLVFSIHYQTVGDPFHSFVILTLHSLSLVDRVQCGQCGTFVGTFI